MQDKLTQLKEFLNFGVTEIVTNEARNYLEPKAKIEEITKCPKVNHPPKIQFKLPESEMKNIQEAITNISNYTYNLKSKIYKPYR